MISYENSKHPGIFIYIALIGLSISIFLVNSTPATIGVLSILWGIYVLMRCLSLYEVKSFQIQNSLKSKYQGASKGSNQNASALAYDLLKRIIQNNHAKRGGYAMQSIQDRTLIWLMLGLGYIAALIYLEYQNTQTLNIVTLAEHSAIAFIIGSAFWAGQTYAYSNSAVRLLLPFSVIMFVITLLYKPPHFISLDIRDYIDILSSVNYVTMMALALLITYSALIMLSASIRGIQQTCNATISIIILAIMSLYALKSYDTAHVIAVWISGWSVISILWIRTYTQKRRKYILYQCE